MANSVINILLLAAGQSARMGKPKQLLNMGNETLIELALKTAIKAPVNGVFCVLGANFSKIRQQIENYPVEIVENKDWENGLGKSIAMGAAALLKKEPETEGILVLLADQPWVDGVYLQKLIHGFEERPDAVVASDYGGFYGVPAVFAQTYFEQLKSLDGDNGAKELLNSAKTTLISVKSPEKLDDIDTPADYEQFLKSHNL